MSEPRLIPATRALAAGREERRAERRGTREGVVERRAVPWVARRGRARPDGPGSRDVRRSGGRCDGTAAATKMLALGTLLGGTITVGLAAALLRIGPAPSDVPLPSSAPLAALRPGGLRALPCRPAAVPAARPAGCRQLRLLRCRSLRHARLRPASARRIPGAAGPRRTCPGRHAGSRGRPGRGGARGPRPGRSAGCAPLHPCCTTASVPPARARGARGRSTSLPRAWPRGRGPGSRLDAEEAVPRVRPRPVDATRRYEMHDADDRCAGSRTIRPPCRAIHRPTCGKRQACALRRRRARLGQPGA